MGRTISSPRSSGLDLLRLVAIVLVIGRHLQVNQSSPSWIRIWNTGGWVGVDLFFVLSGFLVSSLLFAELNRSGGLDVKRFFVRRAFRILPAFWLCIGLSAFVQFLMHDPPRLRELVGEAVFLQNYLGGVWPHTWSLAVEAHFYLVLPWLLLQLHRRDAIHKLPLCFGITVAGCFVLRALSFVVFPGFHARIHFFGTHLRIDSLMLGVFLAWHQQRSSMLTAAVGDTTNEAPRASIMHLSWQTVAKRIPSSCLWLVGLLLLTPAFVFSLETNRWLTIVGVLLLAVGSGCWVVAAQRIPEHALKLLKPFTALGTASYSIYLWHFPIQKWLWPAIEATGSLSAPVWQPLIVVSCSCVVGYLLHHALEAPVLRIRDRLFPSKAIASTRPAVSPVDHQTMSHAA